MDNARCFHGAETLLSVKQLFDESGIFIRRVDFSDPQSGKSACERMASVVKCTVRQHANEKNNVGNSKQFTEVAKTTKYLSAFTSRIIPHSVSTTNSKSSKKIDWSSISTFNNIEYEIKSSSSNSSRSSKTTNSHSSSEIEITMWRSYNVGIGKKFKWSDLSSAKSGSVGCYVRCISDEGKLDRRKFERRYFSSFLLYSNRFYHVCLDISDSDTTDSDLVEEYEESDRKSSIKQPHTRLKMFDYSDPKCIRQYCKEKNLLIHLATGCHKYSSNQLTLLDKAKQTYQDQLHNINIQRTPSLQNFIVIS